MRKTVLACALALAIATPASASAASFSDTILNQMRAGRAFINCKGSCNAEARRLSNTSAALASATGRQLQAHPSAACNRAVTPFIVQAKRTLNALTRWSASRDPDDKILVGNAEVAWGSTMTRLYRACGGA